MRLENDMAGLGEMRVGKHGRQCALNTPFKRSFIMKTLSVDIVTKV